MATVQDAIADLDFELRLDDDEVVADAVVILRITRLTDGRNSVGFTRSSSADMVIVNGLLECARQINDGEWDEAGE